jgi:hypothetical protein
MLYPDQNLISKLIRSDPLQSAWSVVWPDLYCDEINDYANAKCYPFTWNEIIILLSQISIEA